MGAERGLVLGRQASNPEAMHELLALDVGVAVSGNLGGAGQDRSAGAADASAAWNAMAMGEFSGAPSHLMGDPASLAAWNAMAEYARALDPSAGPAGNPMGYGSSAPNHLQNGGSMGAGSPGLNPMGELEQFYDESLMKRQRM